MKDYYKTLGVRRNAKQNIIFRQFRRLILELRSNSNEIQSLLTGFLMLQEKPRKFYNILLTQFESKSTVNEKYINILTGNENQAQNLVNVYEQNRDIFIEPLTKSPIIILLVSAIGPLTGTDLSTTLSFGIGLLLIGVFIIIFNIYQFNSPFLIAGVFLLIFGILLCRKGITEWRREEFNKFIVKNKMK